MKAPYHTPHSRGRIMDVCRKKLFSTAKPGRYCLMVRKATVTVRATLPLYGCVSCPTWPGQRLLAAAGLSFAQFFLLMNNSLENSYQWNALVATSNRPIRNFFCLPAEGIFTALCVTQPW